MSSPDPLEKKEAQTDNKGNIQYSTSLRTVHFLDRYLQAVTKREY